MFFESFFQDLRVGLRVLIKEKSFCFLAVLVLALGIGGATTQFTVVNAIVLRGFSFPHPEQLVSVGLIDPKASDQNNNFGVGNIPTAQDYEDLKAAQHSFSMMAGYLNGSTINLTYKNNPQRYTGAYVTEDLFKIIGVLPVLGRDFTAEDNKPGAEKVAILGDEIWRRDFAADPNVVGQSVRINGKVATIIGVMPPNFKFPISEELWTPLYNEFPPVPRGELLIGANNRAPAVMGRLKPGVTLDQMTRERNKLGGHLIEGHARFEPAQHRGRAIVRANKKLPARDRRELIIKRRPEFLGNGKFKIRRHYADDCGDFAIDPNALPDNVWIGREIASPDFVAQNCDLFCARFVVLGREIAAQDWQNPDDFEKILRDISARITLRIVFVCQVDCRSI